ncbi:cysteine desulfurase [Domibacillus sp. A3M-37]|uniref:cysteine desulfurase family protein n=1 Tax=Domibacillus TaxID=1433999 RepID=UPI000618075A|nr:MULTISPECIES: cysteine desulfurase family protein [Domibacillus]MCP3762471.1 cysteine desulfurase [Domibacillus sp. A3M-37]
MIYFDNSATTMPDQSVLETFIKASTRFFANPSSLHYPGMEAERFLEKARGQIAALCRVPAREIIFTSGGTESNNLAIKGTAHFYKSRGRHIVTTAMEHPSVFEACRDLEKEGFDVTYVKPRANGVIETADIQQAITNETILVSVMHVNNEIGTVQPIEEIGRMLKTYPQTLFHVDAVQGFGKVPLDLNKSGIHLMSVSGHKLHGLKGTGFLYKQSGVQLAPLLSGGGQESGFRSGTEQTAGAAALAKAARLILETDIDSIQHITRRIYNGLTSRLNFVVHTPINQAAPHILNVSLPGAKGEVLVHALEKEGIIVSTTSACSSKQTKPSRTLQSMNVNSDLAASAIRISLSSHNTMQEAEQFIEALDRIIPALAKKRNERT